MLTELVEEWDTGLRSRDPLGFPGYRERIDALDGESVRTGTASIAGVEVVLIEGVFEAVGGSMGVVHGEKVVRAFDRAVARRLPVVVVTRSGGARMQEGMASLVQMARTAAAARRHRDAGLLSIAVHRSPTTGGVFASYGSLCDLSVAEAGATIGFAGPRVVEQTTGVPVGDRSHTAEAARAAGLVDAVRPAVRLLGWVAAALGSRAEPLTVDPPPDPDVTPAPATGTARPAWEAVLGARRTGRPTGVHVAAELCTSWVELGGVDAVVRVGLARIGDRRAVVIAHDRYVGEGRPGPAGYRLARRGLDLAGRLGLPIVRIVDTPGADPGPDAENDGIASEIAHTFAAMAAAPVPTRRICVGEGGSGGALAFVAADRLLIQAGAIFSVIAPEGAAAILERDAARAPELADRLRLTSTDLLELGVVDEIVGDDPSAAAATVRAAVDALTDGPTDGPDAGRRARFDRLTARWITAPPTP